MNDFIEQYDTGHVTDRLYIHWDVSTQCQFKCSYCYAMEQYGWESDDSPGEWGLRDSWFKQELIINTFKRSTLPIFLGLQGGEPTIHPRYPELIEKCIEAVSVHDLGRLYVTTNGLRGPKFFEKQQYYDRLMFLWSFHPETCKQYGNDFYRIVDSIKVCLDKGHRCRVNVMLHSDKKYWSDIHRFIDIIENIAGAEVHPHWIYKDGDPHSGVVDYNEQFYKEFERFKDYPEWLIFKKVDGTKLKLNDYQIFLNGAFNFKDWNCWHNNYEISWDGKVSKACDLGEEANLTISPFYFRNIKKIQPVSCPHTSCACDGHLKIKKCRNLK